MKAKELLRLYQAGERNFSGENLRGQSFKGQDLSDANFTGVNIHGANFTQTILRGANFTGARAGLQTPQKIGLAAASSFLSALFGLSSINAVGIAEGLINSGHEINVLGGKVSLVTYLIFIFFTIKNGLGINAGALALTFSVSTSMAFSLALTVGIPWDIAWNLFVAVVVAFISAWTWVWSCSIAGAIAWAWAGQAAWIIIFTGVFSWYWAWFNNWIWVGETFSPWPLFGGIIGGLLSSYIGWQALAENSKFSMARKISIAVAALGGTSFRLADLTDANFSQAQLKGSDLRQARLIHTNWHRAKGLKRSRVGETILFNPSVRELVVTHRGSKNAYIGCDLKGANLIGANLNDANFTGADISQATFKAAWLERANLTKTQALGTNFHQANLTGVCLEAWNIDSATQLAGTICEYVYLLNHQQERRPSSGAFETGEFTKLFEEVTNTVDLIFREGLNWKAFAYSFQQIEVEQENAQLEIRSIENKGEGVIVVRVNVAPDADKAKIHSSFMENYEFAQKALKAQYEARLEDKDKEINRLFSIVNQQTEKLGEISKLTAEAPKYDLRGSRFAGGFAETVQGDQVGGHQTNELAP